jgi:hypothetical protein
MKDEPQSRRSFVANMAGAAMSFTIVPRHVLGGPGYTAPSDTVNFATIGSGLRGTQDTTDALLVGQNFVALVDVNLRGVESRIVPTTTGPQAVPPALAAKRTDAYAKATKYTDYRVMLEKERNNIDGVIVATPDHNHAIIAKAVMESGKAVYVEKPLTWSVHESRAMLDIARRTGVVTQMGNQGHSMAHTMRMKEIVKSGVLGPISEVHVWTNRSGQGIPRPTLERLNSATARPSVGPPRQAPGGTMGGGGQQQQQPVLTTFTTSGGNVQQALAAAMYQGVGSPPPGMDWELYIGPAPMVQYFPLYTSGWRGWVDFGLSALGDMGAHLIDAPFYALDLDLPIGIEATSTPFGMDVDDTPATWPVSMMVHYEFAGRGAQPPVKLTWYDGGLMPRRPDHLPENVNLNPGGGGYFVGTKGILMYDTYGANPRVYPESLAAEVERVPRTIERIPVPDVEGGSVGAPLHMLNWASAIKGTAKATSSFEYATRLNETMLLGTVALRTGQGRRIAYDGANMRITNIPEANALLTRQYRAGYSL